MIDSLIPRWSPILHPLFKAFYRPHADLNTISWNIFPSSTIFYYWNLCQVLLLDQDPYFKMTSIEAPCKSALEVAADLVEWVLKVLVSVPGFMKIVFRHPDIVEETTGLWQWIKLKKYWECCSPYLHLCSGNIFILSPHNTKDFILGIFLVSDWWWCFIFLSTLLKFIKIEPITRLSFCHKVDFWNIV